jgi:hypothetical protein
LDNFLMAKWVSNMSFWYSSMVPLISFSMSGIRHTICNKYYKQSQETPTEITKKEEQMYVWMLPSSCARMTGNVWLSTMSETQWGHRSWDQINVWIVKRKDQRPLLSRNVFDFILFQTCLSQLFRTS